MRLKIKKFVAINYLIFGICIALSWYYFIPTPHYITTTTDQIDNIKDNLQQRLDINLDLKINHVQNYPKLLETYNTVIKSPLEEKNKAITPSHGALSSENANVILSVDCMNDAKENALEINSFSNFVYKGDCQELENSKALQREVKRVMLALTQGLIDDTQLNLAFEVVHLNINLIKSAKEKKGQSLDSLKKNIIEIAELFFKKLGLSQSHYRLNFQTLFIEDLPLSPKTKNNSTFLEVKELEHFVDTYPSISQEQIYSFETEDINWYIFTQKDIQFVDDDGTYTYFDEKNEKYAVMTASPQESDLKLLVLRTLYRAFELTTLQDLSNNLQNLNLRYQSNFEFNLFNERRRKVLLKKIIHGLESFKYVISDSELVIEKDVGEKIDLQLQQMSALALADNISIQELKDVYSIIFSLNYDGNNKFGHRDSFSDDYRIGVYVPLLLPFLFPILRTLKVIVKRKKSNV